jgi:hypothetical protein
MQGLNKITAPIAEKYWQDFRTVRDAEMARPATSSSSS